jgi:hypothetical protein
MTAMALALAHSLLPLLLLVQTLQLLNLLFLLLRRRAPLLGLQPSCCYGTEAHESHATGTSALLSPPREADIEVACKDDVPAVCQQRPHADLHCAPHIVLDLQGTM